jgi:hypothetical protein
LSGSVLSPSSEFNLAGTSDFDNSLHWKSRSQIEWLFANETVFFVKAFLLVILGLVKIADLPSLVGSIMLFPGDDLLSFNIFALVDIDCFTVLDVEEMLINVLEDLPPLRVSAPDLHVVGSS